MKPILLFLLAATFFFVGYGRSDDSISDSDLYSEIDKFLSEQHIDGRFDGTVVIGNRDQVFYQNAFGIADRTWNTPMELSHRFDIASVNKSFVGVLILKAVEEGKLLAEDRLIDLFFDYKYSGSFHPEITVHHLLTHTSGLPDYDGVADELQIDNFRKFKRLHFSNPEYVDFISQLASIAEPGERFYYSNFAYHLLCIILEDLYDQSFDEILSEKITIPLQMDRTLSTTSNEAVISGLVEAYTFQEGEWRKNSFIDLTLGRRIFSTAGDLYKWALAMDDTTFLKQKSLNRLKKNHLSGITEEFTYGYGWVIIDEYNRSQMGQLPLDKPYIIHGGSTEGFKSILVNVNQGEIIISLLANTGNQTDELQIAREIAEILQQ